MVQSDAAQDVHGDSTIRNQVFAQYHPTGLKILLAVSVLSVLLAPCTMGFSLVFLAGLPLLWWIDGQERESLSMRMGSIRARAWGMATVSEKGRAWVSGGMWAAGEELHFAADSFERHWRLDEIDDVEVMKDFGLASGLCWRVHGVSVRVRVVDPYGWQRVLTSG